MAKVKEAALRVHTRTGSVCFGSISATNAEIVAGVRLCMTQASSPMLSCLVAGTSSAQAACALCYVAYHCGCLLMVGQLLHPVHQHCERLRCANLIPNLPLT